MFKCFLINFIESISYPHSLLSGENNFLAGNLYLNVESKFVSYGTKGILAGKH